MDRSPLGFVRASGCPSTVEGGTPFTEGTTSHYLAGVLLDFVADRDYDVVLVGVGEEAVGLDASWHFLALTDDPLDDVLHYVLDEFGHFLATPAGDPPLNP